MADLFTMLYYAKLDKPLRKMLYPFIASLEPGKFTLDELTSWVERNVTMADHDAPHAKTDIATYVYGEPEDEESHDEEQVYLVCGGQRVATFKCSICGSSQHQKSTHPGPCPLAPPPFRPETPPPPGDPPTRNT